MSTFVAERLSPHTGMTAEGFFIAIAVPVARVGSMDYKCSEIGIPGGDKLVRVWRFPEEVFSKVSMGSGEGKPIVWMHPGRFVSASNWSGLAKGHMQNLRAGTEPLDDGNLPLLADLVISDGRLVEAVKLGLRSCSLGYDTEYEELPNGDYAQRNIVINHCALVPLGRAQNTKIMDGGTVRTLKDIEKQLDQLIAIVERKLAESANRNRQSVQVSDRELEVMQNRVNGSVEARQFCEAANRLGRVMRGVDRDCRPSLRKAADAEEPETWDQALNRVGAEMRTRKR